MVKKELEPRPAGFETDPLTTGPKKRSVERPGYVGGAWYMMFICYILVIVMSGPNVCYILVIVVSEPNVCYILVIVV